MEVILVNEESHGIIGVAKDMRSALDFLIEDGWLSIYSDFWNAEELKYDKFWNVFNFSQDFVRSWSKEDFIDFLLECDIDFLFDGQFYFKKRNVWEMS